MGLKLGLPRSPAQPDLNWSTVSSFAQSQWQELEPTKAEHIGEQSGAHREEPPEAGAETGTKADLRPPIWWTAIC